MTGIMDMQSLMNINNQLENMYDEGKKEQPMSVVLACYGCDHMCASPVGCEHPNGMSVRWDPVRNKSYRIPSIDICMQDGGVCRFYEPHLKRGAGHVAAEKRKAKATVTKIDQVLDQIDDDDVPIQDFIENLKNLDSDLTKEERGESKDETDDTKGST